MITILMDIAFKNNIKNNEYTKRFSESQTEKFIISASQKKVA